MRILVMACTKTKLDRPACAYKLYTGVIWQEWRKHGPVDGLPNGWAMFVLSAEHGLIRSWERIAPYNRTLSDKRNRELFPIVEKQWKQAVSEWGWNNCEVVVVGGEMYQRLATGAGLPIVGRIDGKPLGIGLLRRRVRNFAASVRCGMNVFPGDAAQAWSQVRQYYRGRPLPIRGSEDKIIAQVAGLRPTVPPEGLNRYVVFAEFPGGDVEEIDVDAINGHWAETIAERELYAGYQPGWKILHTEYRERGQLYL